MISSEKSILNFFTKDEVLFETVSVEDLLGLDTDCVIEYIRKNRENLKEITPANIPQFSNFDDLFTVLSVVSGSPEKDLNWEKLGYYLCPKTAKSGAKIKYGENHYKLAIQLSLAKDEKILKLTSLGESVNKLQNQIEKYKIISLLILKIPIVQQIIIEAEVKNYNAFSLMLSYLSKTTAVRRRPNVRKLFSILEEYTKSSKILNVILNTKWIEEKDELS